MTTRSTRRTVRMFLSIAVCSAFIMMVPAAAGETIPTSYKVEGVPLYQQIDARGCGAASLQMVFDYWGPFIDQREIYNAARSGGTALPDMARAAQFSSLSTVAGSRFENAIVTGYTGRSVGYAGFFYASEEPWLDELKSIVAQGYPVIVLVWWAPEYAGGDHYRVVVGYDDTEGMLIINDGWSREFKADSEYQGSTSQSANPSAWDTDFAGVKWTYDDFLKTWRCPTTRWGVPELRYGGVFVAPWEVTISAPSEVSPNERFKVTATITYPCVSPFGSERFATFPAEDFQVTLDPGPGLSVAKAPDMRGIGILSAGDTLELSWTLKAGSGEGTFSFDILATGLVSGSLGPWKDYPAYSYQDLTGGSGCHTVSISSR